MSRLQSFILALLLAATLPKGARAADNGASWGPVAPVASSTSSVALANSPDENDVEVMLGDVSMDFPDDAEQGIVRVSDRVLDGFEAGTSHLRLDNGVVVYWGFKFQEATQRSVAIYDAAHNLRLVAVVNDLIGLTVRGEPRVTSMTEYRQAVERSALSPGVFVFVRDKDDLETYLPILKRWVQADLAGFNVHCDHPGMAPVCELATQVQVPIHAYVVGANGYAGRALALPHVAAASIPLDSFRQ